MQARTSMLALGLTSALLLLVYLGLEREPAPGPAAGPPRTDEPRSRGEPELRTTASQAAPRAERSSAAIAATPPTTEERVELVLVHADTSAPVAEAVQHSDNRPAVECPDAVVVARIRVAASDSSRGRPLDARVAQRRHHFVAETVVPWPTVDSILNSSISRRTPGRPSPNPPDVE